MFLVESLVETKFLKTSWQQLEQQISRGLWRDRATRNLFQKYERIMKWLSFSVQLTDRLIDRPNEAKEKNISYFETRML